MMDVEVTILQDEYNWLLIAGCSGLKVQEGVLKQSFGTLNGQNS
jgi:hypothetical protein